MVNSLTPLSAIVTLIAVSAFALTGVSYHSYVRLAVFLAIAVVGYFTLSPANYNFLSIIIVAVMVFLPAFFRWLTIIAASKTDYLAAQNYVTLLCVFDPVPHNWQAYQFYKMMVQVAQGEKTQEELVQMVESFPRNAFSEIAELLPLLYQANYEEILQKVSIEIAEKNPILATYRYRALGEMGLRDQLVDEVHQQVIVLRQSGKKIDPSILRMLAAFTGNERLWSWLSRPFQLHPYEFRARFWTITYNYFKNNETELYIEKLTHLSDEVGFWDKKTIENRLKSHKTENRALLLEESLRKLEEITFPYLSAIPEKPIKKPFQFKDYLKELSTAYVSIGLFVLYAVFNLWAGSQPFDDDSHRYYHFGTFVYPLNCNWENCWRIISTLFIYSNGAELWVNLFIFLFFPGVEKALGHFRFLAFFFLSGILSLVLPVAIWSLFSMHPQAAVLYTFPSCIAGFWGALLILSYRDWRHKGFREAKHRFWIVSVFVLCIGFLELAGLKVKDTIWLHSFGFMTGLTLTAVYLYFSDKKVTSAIALWKPVLYFWLVFLYPLIVAIETDPHKPLTPEQMNTFGYTYFVTGDMNKSTLWYLKSAHAGNIYAQSWIGREFAFGYNVPVDEAVGRAWLKKAAAQGKAQAALDLAKLDASHEHYAPALVWAQQALKLEKDPKEHADIQTYIRQLELKEKDL